jgi:hypothetical protein
MAPAACSTPGKAILSNPVPRITDQPCPKAFSTSQRIRGKIGQKVQSIVYYPAHVFPKTTAAVIVIVQVVAITKLLYARHCAKPVTCLASISFHPHKNMTQ